MNPEKLEAILQTARESGKETRKSHPTMDRNELSVLARREVRFALKKHGGLDRNTRGRLKSIAEITTITS